MKIIMPKQTKKIIVSIILFIIITAGIYWLVFSDGGKEEENKNAENINQEEIKSDENKKEGIKTEKEKQEFTEYQNQSYGYSVKFSDKWKMNNDFSEKKLEKKKISEEFAVEVGGQTFWSNYADINKYNPGNRPADFRLLALTVYQDEEKNITTEKFAAKLGFEEEISESVPFETENLKGTEFVSPGAEKGRPRIAIIFQKENLFYVFNLALAENRETVEEMENIVKTFKIN